MDDPDTMSSLTRAIEGLTVEMRKLTAELRETRAQLALLRPPPLFPAGMFGAWMRKPPPCRIDGSEL